MGVELDEVLNASSEDVANHGLHNTLKVTAQPRTCSSLHTSSLVDCLISDMSDSSS